jgi:hypothetical protein
MLRFFRYKAATQQTMGLDLRRSCRTGSSQTSQRIKIRATAKISPILSEKGGLRML